LQREIQHCWSQNGGFADGNTAQLVAKCCEITAQLVANHSTAGRKVTAQLVAIWLQAIENTGAFRALYQVCKKQCLSREA
jgi:hypothetical protein